MVFFSTNSVQGPDLQWAGESWFGLRIFKNFEIEPTKITLSPYTSVTKYRREKQISELESANSPLEKRL